MAFRTTSVIVRIRAATAARVREMSLTASFLASEELALTTEADALFVAAVSDNPAGAYDILERRAWGDYSPDSTPESFPTYVTRYGHPAVGPLQKRLRSLQSAG